MFGTFPKTEKDVRGIMAQLQLADLHSYGGKLVNTVGNIAKQMDHIDQDLPELNDLLELTRDPSNFRLLSQALQVVLAANYPADFTPTTQDKFLTAVATVLAVKYK
ncbi:hemoglobin larval subunit alpha-like [Ascaphus truei]|uniref:hemoglobin larval subunit alpha-like n=1 Tax=Ascaphus truei TaxID=8439 RepID=UPI003F595DB6